MRTTNDDGERRTTMAASQFLKQTIDAQQWFSDKEEFALFFPDVRLVMRGVHLLYGFSPASMPRDELVFRLLRSFCDL